MSDDFAALYRLDIEGGVPTTLVRNSVVSRLYALRKLPAETPERDHAIHDIERFLQDLPK